MITFNLNTNSNNLQSKDKIIDSIEILDDGFVAGKYALDSFIYIWHVQHSIGGVQAESRTIDIIPFYKLMWCETDNYYMEISANYGKALIFNLFLVLLLWLNYFKTFFLLVLLNFSFQFLGLGLLTCGDAFGKIWLYDIRCLKTHNLEDTLQTKVIKAFNILDWPPVEDIYHAKSKKLSLETDDIVIGKAVVSPDGKYCVAITDRNTVCLWSETKLK